ncbi:MAG: lysylphosphatidylglycerol synthase transmembrane domain-containing protein, partial [Bryobacteraceae bacterium]
MPTLCYVVSIVSLIWVFKDFKLKEALQDFVALDWRFVTIAVVSDLSIYLCGGWRWTVLLRPVARAGFWRAVQAIYIGLYANEILPLRPGELIRCYLLGLWNDIPMSMALSSAAWERILEGLWLVLGFAITIVLVPKAAHGGTLLGVGFAILAVLLVVIASRRRAVDWASRRSHLPGFLRHVIEGIHVMGNRRTIAVASLASLAYLVLQIIPVWALMQAYGLDLSFWVASVV